MYVIRHKYKTHEYRDLLRFGGIVFFATVDKSGFDGSEIRSFKNVFRLSIFINRFVKNTNLDSYETIIKRYTFNINDKQHRSVFHCCCNITQQ